MLLLINYYFVNVFYQSESSGERKEDSGVKFGTHRNQGHLTGLY